MCISPHSIKVTRLAGTPQVYQEIVHVPCNHCYECVRKRKLDWEIRLTVQSSASAHTYFGMLTYNDEHYHTEHDPVELQRYFKLLRYNLDYYYPGATLKYFCVSEYGELKDRLHYHVLYFVSEEFDDTHLEFQELCKMSWQGKRPLTDDEISFRKHLYNSRKKFLTRNSLKELYNWSRRKFEWQSLGFATAQALKHGTCVGSVHYACKYIQKQYNSMQYSNLGFRPWLAYMKHTGQVTLRRLTADQGYNSLFVYNGSEYPTFPVRGVRYPVPKSWMTNICGKYVTTLLRKQLADKLSTNQKQVDYNKLNSFWHTESERSAFLADKDVQKRKSFEEFERYRRIISSINVEEEWQTIMTQKHTQSCRVEANLTSHSGTLFPLRWD